MWPLGRRGREEVGVFVKEEQQEEREQNNRSKGVSKHEKNDVNEEENAREKMKVSQTKIEVRELRETRIFSDGGGRKKQNDLSGAN